MSKLPKKGSSGEHPSVQALRKKLDSMEGNVPILEDLNARIDKLKEESSTPPPKHDPRRDEDDTRRDSEPAIDVVILPPNAPLPKNSDKVTFPKPGDSNDDE
jgi:hypothetical protein